MLETWLQTTLIALVFVAVAIFGYSWIGRQHLKKKQAYFANLHAQLAPGQDIIFAGGLHGTVKALHGDLVDVTIKSGAVMTISRYCIAEIKD